MLNCLLMCNTHNY